MSLFELSQVSSQILHHHLRTRDGQGRPARHVNVWFQQLFDHPRVNKRLLREGVKKRAGGRKPCRGGVGMHSILEC